MSPNDLRERVRAVIEAHIEKPAWDRAIEVERSEVESMRQFHKAWKQRISGPATKYPEAKR